VIAAKRFTAMKAGSVLINVARGEIIDEEALADAVFVKETGRFRRPLAADHNKIAIRQEPIEIPGAAELAKPRRQGQAWLRVAAGTEDPHTEGGAESTDLAPDSAGAHDARSLAFQ
jgi:D-isomer specific 2-hydroxyacid dehydrogenase, NAD binding domain